MSVFKAVFDFKVPFENKMIWKDSLLKSVELFLFGTELSLIGYFQQTFKLSCNALVEEALKLLSYAELRWEELAIRVCIHLP